MNQQQLSRMSKGLGFIAALDQSGGSTPKALKAYGVEEERYQNDEEMFALVHDMRTRIIKCPSFTSKRILGAILFENTMESKIDGLFTADYLWEKKGIVPFLKIDKGLAQLADGVQIMKPILGLEKTLKRAIEQHVFGTKMRSVIKSANPTGITAIAKQQFDIAKVIMSFGLVPIIEPEVDIHIEDKKEAEALLLKELKKNLDLLETTAKVIFKLTIPTKNNLYQELMDDQRVARVVALSGGYSRDKANHLLALNNGLIASFSRALTQGILESESEEEFNSILKTSVDSIYQASIT